MKFFPARLFIFFLPLFLLFLSCSTTRNVDPGKYLVRKNIITIQDDSITDERSLSDDLWDLAKQKPNGRIFGLIPLRLWFYKPDRDPNRKFGQLLHRKLEEAPVIFDSTQAALSAQ